MYFYNVTLPPLNSNLSWYGQKGRVPFSGKCAFEDITDEVGCMPPGSFVVIPADKPLHPVTFKVTI